MCIRDRIYGVNKEVIVIDDCSTDNSIFIINKPSSFDPKRLGSLSDVASFSQILFKLDIHFVSSLSNKRARDTGFSCSNPSVTLGPTPMP